MKNHIRTLILFQLFSYQMFSQEIKMSGTLVDAEDRKPIEFVNIGLLNKNQGTISNPNGKFILVLPKQFKTDSLTISHINYYPIKILAKAFNDRTIVLEPKTIELSEVVVSNKKRKTRKVGVKSYNRLISMRVVSEANDIIEVAQRINVPTKEVKIKAANFNIRKWSEVEGVNVRINFYENLDNAPGAKIINKNVVQKIPLQTDSGWIHIDLNDYNIFVYQDLFIGIEFIPNFNDPTIVDLGAILTKGKGYTRRNSLGSWGKLNGGASINVEIEY